METVDITNEMRFILGNPATLCVLTFERKQEYKEVLNACIKIKHEIPEGQADVDNIDDDVEKDFMSRFIIISPENLEAIKPHLPTEGVKISYQ